MMAESVKTGDLVAHIEQSLAEAPDVAIERSIGKEKIANKILKHCFLRALGRYGTVTKAQEEVAAEFGVLPSRLRISRWVRKDERFRKLFVLASEEYADRLEEAARERAVEGWEEPVYQRGELVGSVRKYSDPLLQMLLKGAKPQRYRDVVGVQHETATERREALNKELARLSLMPAPAQLTAGETIDAEVVAEPSAPTE
jgi:hypothetical protein